MNTWRFVMHGPDGVHYQNKSAFAEIAKPERIVFDQTSGPKIRMTITLAEEGGKTTINWRRLLSLPPNATRLGSSRWRQTNKRSTARRQNWRQWRDAHGT